MEAICIMDLVRLPLGTSNRENYKEFQAVTGQNSIFWIISSDFAG
jgi:hypothetical protein